MATNKTRIAYYDYSTGIPYQVAIIKEFDIYQDSIDYVETFAKSLLTVAGSYSWIMYIYSYDNPSYSYLRVGDEIVKTTITFPNLL
jgi:hypothetical protein